MAIESETDWLEKLPEKAKSQLQHLGIVTTLETISSPKQIWEYYVVDLPTPTNADERLQLRQTFNSFGEYDWEFCESYDISNGRTFIFKRRAEVKIGNDTST